MLQLHLRSRPLGSCSRDPIGYWDYRSLYYARFVGKGTDPYGLSDFIHPGDIDTIDGCAKWEAERLADCYELLGWFINKDFLDCISAVRDAAQKCRNRQIDDGLHDILDANCCGKQPTQQEQDACKAEAQSIMKSIGEARDEIYKRGGPSRTQIVCGAVCTTCEDIVKKKLSGKATHYFAYETKAATAGLYIGIPGCDHCWGQLYCRSGGENRYGKVLVTIDFWKGEYEYWKEGEGGFGW